MIGITFMPQFGVQGIVTLSKKIRKLEATYSEEDAMLYLATLVQAIEEIGTCGAGYRYMYGVFLHEAAEMLNKPKLEDFSMKMTHIGDLWRLFSLECSRKFKNRTQASFDDLADKLVEIAAKEKDFFTELGKFIKTECKK